MHASYALLFSGLANQLAVVNQFLEIFLMVLAPLLVIYAIVAYRGQYESRSMPVLIFLAVAISLAAVFHVAAGNAYVSNANSIAHHFNFFENVALVLSMLALLLVLRSYVHSEIDLIKKREWKPREVLRQSKRQ
ncbi:MAG: hypothetical protein QW343_03740 [Candidatus Norongarragalinales archaeon]